MSLEDIIIHIRIEEQNKTRDKVERSKELFSKENVIEERPRPEKILIFLRNGKIVISVKIRNFSKSWMMKRTSPLESSHKI